MSNSVYMFKSVACCMGTLEPIWHEQSVPSGFGGRARLVARARVCWRWEGSLLIGLFQRIRSASITHTRRWYCVVRWNRRLRAASSNPCTARASRAPVCPAPARTSPRQPAPARTSPHQPAPARTSPHSSPLSMSAVNVNTNTPPPHPIPPHPHASPITHAGLHNEERVSIPPLCRYLEWSVQRCVGLTSAPSRWTAPPAGDKMCTAAAAARGR